MVIKFGLVEKVAYSAAWGVLPSLFTIPALAGAISTGTLTAFNGVFIAVGLCAVPFVVAFIVRPRALVDSMGQSVVIRGTVPKKVIPLADLRSVKLEPSPDAFQALFGVRTVSFHKKNGETMALSTGGARTSTRREARLLRYIDSFDLPAPPPDSEH